MVIQGFIAPSLSLCSAKFPACTAPLLVLAKTPTKAAKRLPLLKEIVSIYMRQANIGDLPEIRSTWDRDAKKLVEALICLGDEHSDLEGQEGA